MFIYNEKCGLLTLPHPTPKLRTASLVRISNAKPTPNMICYPFHSLYKIIAKQEAIILRCGVHICLFDYRFGFSASCRGANSGVKSASVNTNQYICKPACPYNGSAVCNCKVKHFFWNNLHLSAGIL